MEEKQFEVIDIPVIGVFNKRTNELVNLVYKNDQTKAVIVCDVSPTRLEGIRGLFNNLMGK